MSGDGKTAPAVRMIGTLEAPPRPAGPLGKCAPCLDAAITGPESFVIDAVPDAVVLVTVIQMFPVAGGQQMAAPALMGVCLACRQKQLGTVSKRGLVTA